MRSPEALFEVRKRSIGFNGTASGSSTTPRIPFSNASDKNVLNATPPIGNRLSPRQIVASLASPSRPFVARQTTPTMPSVAQGGGSVFQHAPTRAVSSSDVDQGPIAQLHPAIRAQYAALLQKKSSEGREPQNVPQARLSSPNQQSTMGLSTLSQPLSTPTPGHIPTVSSDVTQSKVDSRTPSTSGIPDQKPAILMASTRVPSIPPKQTYIPPPRPWETLRKTQPPVQLAQPPPSQYPLSSTATPAAAIPAAFPSPSPSTSTTVPGPFAYDGPGNSRHMASPGLQPSNVSGPLWHEFPQTVPNSNSLGQNSYGQFPYRTHHQSPSHRDYQQLQSNLPQQQYSNQGQPDQQSQGWLPRDL